MPESLRAALLAAAGAVLVIATGTLLARADDDAAKWHVGETDSASGPLCETAEVAAAGAAAIDDLLDETGGFALPEIVAPLAGAGCVFLHEQLTFVGIIPDSKVYVAHTGLRFAFVEWIVVDGDFHAFGFMPVRRISDRPYLAPGSL